MMNEDLLRVGEGEGREKEGRRVSSPLKTLGAPHLISFSDIQSTVHVLSNTTYTDTVVYVLYLPWQILVMKKYITVNYVKQVSDCFQSVKILPDSRIIYVRNVTILLLYVFFVLFQDSNRKIRCYQFIIL